MNDLREQLAALAHEMWSGWMRYMLGKCQPNDDGSGVTVPAAYESALVRQMTTAYEWLSDAEKDADRAEADKVLALIEDYLADGPHNKCASGLAQSTGICAVVGCYDRSYADNLYCPTHRRRYQRHGDPTTILKRGRKKRGNP